jgi:hypothetical protein
MIMRMRDWKERYRAVRRDGPPQDEHLYAQVRPSSGLRYPRLELDRWYPVRRHDDLGCFVEVGSVEMYLERGHYVTREGRRGSDRSKPVVLQGKLGEGRSLAAKGG